MDKLKDVDWRGIAKSAAQKVKKYTLNLTDLEMKVEEATNLETWGPHGSVMNEIADASFDPENYRQIMGVLARRLQEKEENWRMCYKALLLLEHLIKHGPGKIIGDVQSSAAVLERLSNFQYKDDNLRDHGVNVRHRAKEILELVDRPDRLKEERDKAKANRTKYTGVSADQMRSTSFGMGGMGGGSSFGRSTSDRYTSGTSGSLFPSSGGGGGGGGGIDGSSTGAYGQSRRTDSYDGTGGGAHYISKRGGSSAPAEVPAGTSSEDAVAATRARIDKLKLSGGAGAEEKHAADESKKKLTNVRVNPKIAASLGLKIPVQPPPPAPAAAAAAAPTPAATAAAAAPEIDLLGGMDEPAIPAAPAFPAAPAAAAFDPFGAGAAPAAPVAPTQPAAAASFDPFGAGAPAPAAAAASPAQPWDAFAAGPGSAATPAPAAAASFGMLGGLDSAGTATQPAPQQADPFAAFASTAPTPAFASFPAAPAAKSAPPAAAPLPAVTAGVPNALPEDMFADLTGIGGKPQNLPIGNSPRRNTPGAAAASGMGGEGGGWGMPAASPSSPGGGFGSFSTAPAGSGTLPGISGMGGMPVGAGMQQPAPVAGHARTGSMGGGGGAVDFGSLSYTSAPQGGASAADPFADLLK